MSSEPSRYLQTGEPTGEIGCVTFIHRFNSALAPHNHTMVLDGVFVRDDQGGVRFVQARATSDLDVAALLADGRVSLELKRPYHDGTTHLVFQPLVFIERLAALVPKPNKNLVIYSGVLAPNAKLRSAVVAYGRPVAVGPPTDPIATTPATAPTKPKKPRLGRPNYRWPELMRRSFGIDVLQCKDCGGALTLVDIVMNSRAIQGILKSLGLPTEPPLVHASRAPPDDPYDHYDAAWRSQTSSEKLGAGPSRECTMTKGQLASTLERLAVPYAEDA